MYVYRISFMAMRNVNFASDSNLFKIHKKWTFYLFDYNCWSKCHNNSSKWINTVFHWFWWLFVIQFQWETVCFHKVSLLYTLLFSFFNFYSILIYYSFFQNYTIKKNIKKLKKSWSLNHITHLSSNIIKYTYLY